MGYLTLTRRQKTGVVVDIFFDKNGDTLEIIELQRPYSDGISFSVIENTPNPFCSNGLYKTFAEAKEHFEIMKRNLQY